jgi:hypothetical protein
MNNFVQFHNNKIGNMNPEDKVNTNITKLKQKLSRVTELVLVEPITYIIPANTLICSHISATRVGRETVHVKMAFTIKDEKISTDLIRIENKIVNSLDDLFKNKELYRPTIKSFENANVFFFAKHMEMDQYDYNLKQHYDEDPYTNIDYIHFDKKHYVWGGNYIDKRVQEWKRVDNKEWVKFNFLMTIYAVSKTKSNNSEKEKRWSMRFKLEPTLPFWLETD